MVVLIRNIDEETKVQRDHPKVGLLESCSAGAETQGPGFSPELVRVPLRSNRFAVLYILGRTCTLKRFCEC